MAPAISSASVSVIICAYADRRWKELLAAIASVAGQSAPPLETIVVVDHNRALSDRLRVAVPDVRVLDNAQQRGLSGARNTGVATARGALVAFLDDDAVAAPDWLAWLTPTFEDSRVVAVGGATDPLWAGPRPRWFPDEFGWVLGYSYRGLPPEACAVRNPFGCNMVICREVVEAVGGFRHGIGRVGTHPVGGEETDLCIRARQLRPETIIIYEPRARIGHWVPEDRARPRYFARRCYAEGLSKALIAERTGADAALASERDYVRHVLPAGVARGLGDALGGRDAAGAARAAAILGGLAITTLGYVRAAAELRMRRLRARALTLPGCREAAPDDHGGAGGYTKPVHGVAK